MSLASLPRSSSIRPNCYAGLLRRHYRRQVVPCTLDERLVHVLRKNTTFDAWPLETIVPNREAFFSFLQERWPLFLNRLAAELATSIEDGGDR